MEQSPIETLDLFPEVQGHLLRLLEGLSPEEWHLPTMCSAWQVKDIVAHLLDTNLRRLSLHRDGYFSPHLSPGEGGLMPFLNRLNAEWTQAAYRLSPRVLIALLEWSGERLVAFLRTLPPFGLAAFPVAWAGEEESRNWFDIAREYTEKWHHSQQIFEAVGRPSPLLSRRLYFPVLETFLRALPFALRDARGSVRVVVEGEAGGVWEWNSGEAGPAATVVLPQADAWKAWTKRRPVDEQLRAFPGIRIEGDVALGRLVVGMVSVMA